jgi:hypothetical protein
MTNKTTIEKFINELKELYLEFFPNSASDIYFYKTSYGSPSIEIKFYLANNENELPNGYWQNDMFNFSFSIKLPKGIEQSSELPLEMVLVKNASSYLIKPSSSAFYANGRDISFRKTTGNEKKIKQSLTRLLGRVKASIESDIESNEIHRGFVEIVSRKITK